MAWGSELALEFARLAYHLQPGEAGHGDLSITATTCVLWCAFYLLKRLFHDRFPAQEKKGGANNGVTVGDFSVFGIGIQHGRRRYLSKLSRRHCTYYTCTPRGHAVTARWPPCAIKTKRDPHKRSEATRCSQLPLPPVHKKSNARARIVLWMDAIRNNSLSWTYC